MRRRSATRPEFTVLRGGQVSRSSPPEEQGPEDVELLLDRQGPQVLEQRRRGAVEVVPALEDHHPVAGVGQGAEPLATQARGELVHRQPRERGGAHERHQHGRDESSDALHPEGAQRHAPARVHTTDQAGGDEEAGEHEEHVHAHEPAAQEGGPGVEDEHGEHRDPPQPVEGGHPAGAAADPRADLDGGHAVLGRQGMAGHGRGALVGTHSGRSSHPDLDGPKPPAIPTRPTALGAVSGGIPLPKHRVPPPEAGVRAPVSGSAAPR